MSDGPRILTLDIETSPAKVYVFDLWNQNIGINQVIEPTRVISFAAKWVGSPRVMFFSEFHSGADLQSGREEMIASAYGLLDQADAVVTYNGDRFDLPHLNREFAEFGLGRPAPYHSIDLFKTVKKNQRWLSNKLAWVTERLELGGKLETGGFELWRSCLEGDPKAWAKMRRYNKQDVVTTEELYIELLPWIDSHPTFQLYVDDASLEPKCPRCNSTDIQKRGYTTTKVSKFQRYQCQTCGVWSRGGKRLAGVDLR